MNYIKQILYSGKIKNFLELGTEHLEDENYFSAITFFSHALELNETCEEARFNRAKAFYSVKNFNKAISDLEYLVNTSPNYNSECYYLLAKSELSLCNNKKAVEYADEYYSQNRENIDAQYFLARANYLKGDFAKALDLVDLLIMERELDFDLRYLRSLILFAQENFVSAILDINKAIEIDSLNAFTYNLRALINIQLFNYKDAVNDFNYAIRLNPLNSIHYFNKAKIQQKIGDLLEAKNSIDKAIELDGKNKAYFLLKGELELLAENNIEALDAYNSAYKLDTHDLELLNEITNLKLYMGDYFGAQNDLNNLKEITHENSETYYAGAFLEYELGDNEQALCNLRKAIEITPDFNEAILQNGILELSLKNNTKAIEIFNLIHEENHNYYKSCLYKAQAYFQLGKLEDAEEEINKIDSNYIENNTLVYSSHINYLKGNFEDSEKGMQKFIELNQNIDSTKIIINFLKAQQRNLSEIEELSEFNYKDKNKTYAQIINGVVNFEKGQYYSAKYRLSNLSGISEENMELIMPLIEFSEKQIS